MQNLTDLVEEFLGSRDLSKESRRIYKKNVGRFTAFLSTLNAELTAATNTYLTNVRETRGPSMYIQIYSNLNCFFNYAVERNILNSNPLNSIKKYPKRVKEKTQLLRAKHLPEYLRKLIGKY